MFKTIKQILKTGDATVTYPAAPLHLAPDYRGKPEHDPVACIACAACAVACPPNAIQMVVDMEAGTETWSINFGRCIFCGRCEEVCPTDAIKLGNEFELAVMDKRDLEETATYRLQACERCGSYYATAKEVDYVTRVLEQGTPEGQASGVSGMVRMCPACRQRADAYRAQRSDQTGGAKKKMEAKA